MPHTAPPSVSASAATLTAARSYNAFGEVVGETDALGSMREHGYNAMGRMIRTMGPTVSITNEDGSSQWVRVAQDLYYDLSGRLVGTRDGQGTYAAGGTQALGAAKVAGSGHLTTRSLLAGSGYDGAEALVVAETHGDGGVRRTGYDIYGDARVLNAGYAYEQATPHMRFPVSGSPGFAPNLDPNGFLQPR